jgi:hypothetical protein
VTHAVGDVPVDLAVSPLERAIAEVPHSIALSWSRTSSQGCRLPGTVRASAPAPAWRPSAPLGPGSSGCQAAVRRLPASESSPAVPAAACTSPFVAAPSVLPATRPALTLRCPRSAPHPPPAPLHCYGPAGTRGPGCLPGTPCRRADRRVGRLRLRLCIELRLQVPDLLRGFQSHVNPRILTRFPSAQK